MSDNLTRMAADPMAFFLSVKVSIGGKAKVFGSIMADFQRERLEAIAPNLVAVARGTKPPCDRHFWDATKGSSKDSDLALCLLWLVAFSTRSLVIQLAAASSDQAAELLQVVRQLLRDNRFLASRVEVLSSVIRCKQTDVNCDVLAADEETSHGARPDVLIINELCHIANEEFPRTLLDNASKMPDGLVCIATNAGRIGNNLAWTMRELARTSPRWSFHQLARPAPWISETELEEARLRNAAARYKRLFWGVWSTGESDWIDQSLIEAAITRRGPMTNPVEIRNCTIYMAVDAGVKRDRSALVVLAVPRDSGRVVLAWAEHWRPAKGQQVDLTKVESAIRAKRELYNPIATYFDPSQMLHMAQRLRRMNVRMEEMNFTGGNLNLMADRMVEAFSAQIIDLYNFQPLIEDLGRITIEEKAYGQRLTAIAGPDGHADLAVALSICLPAAMRIATGGRVEGKAEYLSYATPETISRPGMISGVEMDKVSQQRKQFLKYAAGRGRGWRF